MCSFLISILKPESLFFFWFILSTCPWQMNNPWPTWLKSCQVLQHGNVLRGKGLIDYMCHGFDLTRNPPEQKLGEKTRTMSEIRDGPWVRKKKNVQGTVDGDAHWSTTLFILYWESAVFARCYMDQRQLFSTDQTQTNKHKLWVACHIRVSLFSTTFINPAGLSNFGNISMFILMFV